MSVVGKIGDVIKLAAFNLNSLINNLPKSRTLFCYQIKYYKFNITPKYKSVKMSVFQWDDIKS